ncbi:hypothetical protein D3C80_2024880 [compost metagenome]
MIDIPLLDDDGNAVGVKRFDLCRQPKCVPFGYSPEGIAELVQVALRGVHPFRDVHGLAVAV